MYLNSYISIYFCYVMNDYYHNTIYMVTQSSELTQHQAYSPLSGND